MSKQFPGGIISKTPVTPSGPYETSTASGIWTLEQQAYYKKLNQWPIAGSPAPDAQFNYVTMLLHGDGTNGAQNNTFLDSSTNNFTITRNGNTTQGSFSPYGSNWSNNLNGSSSFSLSNNTALDMGTGDFTLEFWVFSTDASIDSQYRRFVVTGTNSTSAIQVGHIGATSGVVAYTADDATLTITGTTNVLNTWAHIAVVRQSGTVKLYVNGTSEGTPITDSNSKTTSNFNIGRYPALSGYLNGNISNIRLVKGTAVYTSNFTPSTTPLTAISGTSLLTCQSNRFIDNSANAFTLTTNGTPSVQRFNPFGASTAYSTSVIGGSGYFDGSGDNLSVAANSSNLGTGDFNITFWLYFPTEPLNGVPATNAYNATAFTNGWYFYTGVGTDISFGLGSAGGADAVSGSVNGINSWHYVEATRSGSTLSLYLDGVLAQSKSNTKTGTVSGNITRIGARYDGGGNAIAQYITDFKVVIGTAGNTSAYTPPTAPASATGSTLMLSMQNAAIFDNAMMNDLETVGNAQISTSVVKYGTGSLAFDGTGDYLVNANSINLAFNTGNFTIEGWFNRTSGSNNGLFQLSTTAGGFVDSDVNNLAIGVAPTDLTLYANNSTTTSSTVSITNGTWNHFALVRSGTTTTLYYNGVSVLSLTDSKNYTGTYLVVGGYYSTTYVWNGYIDDFRITKGYARYTANFTPPTAAFQNIGPT